MRWHGGNLEIEDPKLNAKIDSMAEEWQITPDETVNLIIKLSIGQVVEDYARSKAIIGI
ncbi:hypothetical protein [Pelosinus sp. IPA-1]|uniref:hypothetical protein n=1 Tax=Pelosinus sp. IPA-1 TaxID=3029569 RepID=UPI0024361EA1|nr:hypothetical protein [Pelosinus sp. IPA-1]GMB01849.1 hypothetical protein PIPA1_46490 [Pelosinus sp. IPA-1]